MGELSKWELGHDRLPSTALIFGGNTPPSSVASMVDRYERVLFHKHDNSLFIVESLSRRTLLVFQVYGAPFVADLLCILRDGGTRYAVFLGAAYGLNPELRIADCVLPTKVRCLDGFSQAVGAADWAHPDLGLRSRVAGALRTASETFLEGPTVSVPSTFFHGDGALLPPDAVALEIELAAFFHVGASLGIECAAALVISDNAAHTLLDDRSSRDERLIRLFDVVRKLEE